ncbi:MAG: zinc ribbon domain-containing protein [Firmicutes bacterium]|nr:zinc ribbon domain-containing protein [Bacillota bacterium]
MAERREIWDSIIKRSQKVAASVAKQAQTIAQTAQKKTAQTVDTVKVENQIKKTRQILQEEYAMLGQVTYQIEKGNVNRDADVLKAACKRIERTLERIAELQEEKQKIAAGEEVKADETEETAQEPAAADAEEESGEDDEADDAPVMKICPYCNAGNAPDAKVCVACGKELE